MQVKEGVGWCTLCGSGWRGSPQLAASIKTEISGASDTQERHNVSFETCSSLAGRFMAAALVCVLVVGGCTSASPARVIPTVNLTAALPPAQCPPTGGPEITIDPISNHSLGDIIMFGGTTNLNPGELLAVQITSGYVNPCTKCQEIINDSVETCCGTGIERQEEVMPGRCGINTWSVEVDTSRHDFAAGEPYLVTTYGRNGTVWNGSNFTLVE